MRIDHLSNQDLLASLRTVVGDERRLVAQMLARLAEVEARGLHLELACPSLLDFCMRHLELSEDQACRRIAVARVGRRFPQLFEAIASGRMHLSGVHQLREHFTEANVDDLVAALSGKSRAEIDLLIAKLAPKPPVPASIRKLPEQAPLVPAPTATPGPMSPAPAVRQLVPLSEATYRVTFTASSELREKIEQARVLLRLAKSDDIAAIIERALELLIEKLEREKLGKAKRPRRSKGTTDPGDVTRETRRAVYERDGHQCAFVGANGERCPARELLELDHRHPRARGGTGRTENIRLLCRAHNQFVAEQAFGRDHMERKRGRSTRTAATPQSDLGTASAATTTVLRDVQPSASDDERGETPTRPLPRVVGADPAEHETSETRSVGPTEPSTTTEAAPHHDGIDPRSPREVVRYGLIRLGFRSKDTDRVLDALPPSTWTEPLETILRIALARLS